MLYRLPELIEAVGAGRRIYVTEGEKDADNVRLQGLDATTASGGAGQKWLPAYSDALKGADVVILPDNDQPGETHAHKVATGLMRFAASVRVLRLPNLAPKGDVSDWLQAGGTADKLEALADATPLYDGRTPPPSGPGGASPSESTGLQWAQRNDEGAPIANLANVMAALRTAPSLSELFAYDEMLRMPLLMAPLPGGKSDWKKPRPVSDDDVGTLQEWLQFAGLRRIGRDIVHQAVDMRAMERRFHPVRDYLKVLRWDGKPRLATWLHEYLGAESTPYTAGMAPCSL